MIAKEQMSKSLRCGITVSGNVYAIAQLSAKFQIKARDYGLTDSESLAVWIDGDKDKVKIYYNGRIDDYHNDLKNSNAKLLKAPKNWKL